MSQKNRAGEGQAAQMCETVKMTGMPQSSEGMWNVDQNQWHTLFCKEFRSMK